MKANESLVGVKDSAYLRHRQRHDLSSDVGSLSALQVPRFGTSTSEDFGSTATRLTRPKRAANLVPAVLRLMVEILHGCMTLYAKAYRKYGIFEFMR